MSGAAVGRYLADRGISFAVIGAQALMLRGVARFSLDTDLLTMDGAVLAAGFWHDLENASAEARRGS